jgi:hypothetical protein
MGWGDPRRVLSQAYHYQVICQPSGRFYADGGGKKETSIAEAAELRDLVSTERGEIPLSLYTAGGTGVYVVFAFLTSRARPLSAHKLTRVGAIREYPEQMGSNNYCTGPAPGILH